MFWIFLYKTGIKKFTAFRELQRQTDETFTENSVSNFSFNMTYRGCQNFGLTQEHNRLHWCRIMSLGNYKFTTYTSLHWTHPVRHTQTIELPVNLYIHWNSILMHWTGLCYCVMTLWREIWRNVKVTAYGYVTPYSLVDKSTSLHQDAV